MFLMRWRCVPKSGLRVCSWQCLFEESVVASVATLFLILYEIGDEGADHFRRFGKKTSENIDLLVLIPAPRPVLCGYSDDNR